MKIDSTNVTVEVNDAIHDLSDKFLACRDLGHVWRQFSVVKKERYYERSLSCPTCKTIRHETITLYGERISTYYQYPKNYVLNGVGRIDKNAKNKIRLESIDRTLEKAVST